MNMARDNENSVSDSRKLTGFSAEIYEWMEAIAFALAIVVLLFTFVFRVVAVDGTSMDTTLADGDRLLVNSLFYTPERGDIVIVVTDSDLVSGPIVKRVIGVEGDRIKYDPSTGAVWVNGKELSEPYVDVERIGGASSTFDDTDEITVKQGCVFIMGDNRKVSLDSRTIGLRDIRKEDVLGHVILRIYPFDKIGAPRG